MRLKGLIAATFTPMDETGALQLERVPALVEHLVQDQVGGLYVCGSTGEGPLLTTAERKAVAEAHVAATAGRLPVVIQVGHNSLADARDLAAHAQAIGADALSATPPGYFKPADMDSLLACMENITQAAPKLPFYYYNIPQLSGVQLDMIEFLRRGAERIPTLRGIKYSACTIEEFHACLRYEDGRFDLLFGSDPMLLSALVVGAEGAVGSTYNFAAPLYNEIIRAFKAGELERAREVQAVIVVMVRIVLRYRGLAGLKALMKLCGHDCGPTRLPLVPLTEGEEESLRRELEGMHFFERLSG